MSNSIDYGCIHYKRRCKIVSPCCGKIYTCRHCHNDSEDHEIDRFSIQEIICTECDYRQGVKEKCENCGVSFGSYYCEKCNFFDDNIDQKYYHCDKCGFCRVGKNGDTFHCDECDCCFIKDKEKSHQCRKNIMKNNCPICFEDLFNSIMDVSMLKCGHPIHSKCLSSCLNHFKYNCPVCRKSIIRNEVQQKLNEEIDQIIDENQMEDEIYIQIKCNDCLFEGESKYHPYGIKCLGCGGYNTAI